MSMELLERTVLDESILDQSTECDLADQNPYRPCHAVAEYVGTMPCGQQFLSCEDHMARIAAGWTQSVGCNCDQAQRSAKGVKCHWMVDVTWRRA